MQNIAKFVLPMFFGSAVTLLVYRTFWDSFFIMQFGGTAPISSRYFVDLNHLGSELLFVGDGSSRIVSGGNIKPEFLEFSARNKTHVDTACGLQLWSGVNSKRWKLVHDGKNYLYFVEVDDVESSKIIAAICKTRHLP